jgi:hypothetical protein
MAALKFDSRFVLGVGRYHRRQILHVVDIC